MLKNSIKEKILSKKLQIEPTSLGLLMYLLGEHEAVRPPITRMDMDSNGDIYIGLYNDFLHAPLFCTTIKLFIDSLIEMARFLNLNQEETEYLCDLPNYLPTRFEVGNIVPVAEK